MTREGKPTVRFAHPVLHEQYHERTFGERAADLLAAAVGSWRFVLIQTAIIFGVWIPLNLGMAWWEWTHLRHFDPYPFVFLNFLLSLQAAYTGPVLQLSSNRQSLKDRALWEHTALQADKNDQRTLAMMEGMLHLLEEARGNTQAIERELLALRREEAATATPASATKGTGVGDRH